MSLVQYLAFKFSLLTTRTSTVQSSSPTLQPYYYYQLMIQTSDILINYTKLLAESAATQAARSRAH